jgi:hypothetical protein
LGRECRLQSHTLIIFGKRNNGELFEIYSLLSEFAVLRHDPEEAEVFGFNNSQAYIPVSTMGGLASNERQPSLMYHRLRGGTTFPVTRKVPYNYYACSIGGQLLCQHWDPNLQTHELATNSLRLLTGKLVCEAQP